MGNSCSTASTPKRNKHFPGKAESVQSLEAQKTEEEVMEQFYGTELHFLPFQERRAQLEEWLSDIQDHNRERLRKEMLTDLHTFILNNILLSVQFYANFDSALLAAKDFKKTTEAKMTEKLVPLTQDGMILGERKCLLVHGMGQQLHQNYIYRDDGHLQKKQSSAESEGRKRHVTIAPPPEKATSGELDEPRSTFTCDSILPLEFMITWDNLEVYKESEWYDLQNYESTSVKGQGGKGSPGVCRVCIEETDDKNKIPRGFVRVRVVDTPISLRPVHPLPALLDPASASPSGSVGYAAPSFSTTEGNRDAFHEEVHEVRTESDLSTSGSSDSESDAGTSDLSAAFLSGMDFMNNLKSHIESASSTNAKLQQPASSVPKSALKVDESYQTKSAPKLLPIRNTVNSSSGRLTGGFPERYQSVMSELSKKHIVPEVTVSAPTTPVTESPAIVSSAGGSVSRRFETRVTKIDSIQRSSTLLPPSSALASRRKSRSLPSIAPPPPPPKLEQSTTTPGSSSGYSSVSPAAQNAEPMRSRSNSTSNASDDIHHHKWRQAELKRLWQFLPKRRLNATEPLSPSCFQKIQIEVDSDDDDVLETETDEDESESGNSDFTDSDLSSTNERPRDLSEPKYEDRTYLNSIGFSADFCSEFKQVGSQLGIDEGPLRSAVILGTTIRCAVTQPFDFDQKGNSAIAKSASTTSQYSTTNKKVSRKSSTELTSKLYTFTPTLHSKQWPQKPLIWWKGQMLREAWEGAEKWPTREQVERIEEEGCCIVPLGNRSIHSTQSENVKQTLVWSVAFPQAENILLDSMLHVQWRCLSFSVLIFRAFLAPLGPLGIGLEHIRNILYFMCQEEFISWNFEQPALHLKALLDRLYDCLGRGDMPSFFIVGHNLFKNIPAHNLRKVQAYLSRVRNNLLFYGMFMLRNMVQVNSDFYPWPKDNFKKLYEYLTVPEHLILYLVNPLLAGITTEDLKKESKDRKRKKKEKKEINQALLMNGELIDSAYGNLVNKDAPKFRLVDQEQRKLRRKRERWMEKQQKIRDYEAEEARNAREAEQLPQEKKNSIDLEEKPLKQRQFSPQRLGLILKYFIKHFIKMAAKSYQFKSYAQASMYAQHVENLISLLCELPNEAGSADTEKFQENAKLLRETIGPRMIDYIQEKISHVGSSEADVGSSTKVFDHISGLLASPGNSTGMFSNNWQLRTLPTPPPSVHQIADSTDESFKTNSYRTNLQLNSKNMARSLASLSLANSNPDDDLAEVHTVQHQASSSPRRGPMIKWNSNPAFLAASTPTLHIPRIRSKLDGDNVTFGLPVVDR